MAVVTLLKLVGPVHIVAGLALAFLPFFPSLHGYSVDMVFGSGAPRDPTLFLLSVFGPTIASWGILFTALVNQYFKKPEQYLWNILFVSVLVWVVFDTSLCLYYKVYFGAVLNFAVASSILLLLFLSRKNSASPALN